MFCTVYANIILFEDAEHFVFRYLLLKFCFKRQPTFKPGAAVCTWFFPQWELPLNFLNEFLNWTKYHL